MLLYFFLPKEHYSTQEKKVLSDFPAVTAQSVFGGEFQQQLDTYLADHVPLRNQLVGFSSAYELVTGRNGKKGIYFGNDGYLIPKPTQETEQLSKNIGFIKEFADSVDLPVYMTIVPSSGYVNPEKLPSVHETYRDGELIDKYSAKLGDSVRFVDVKAAFCEKAGSEQLYYKTDHHWTAKGAYECYCLLGDAMHFQPVAEESFQKERVDGFYGTSYSKSALWWVSPDTLECWNNKSQSKNAVSVVIKDGEDVKEHKSYYFTEHFENDDKYPAYLDGNHSVTRIKNTDAHGGKLVVVKDSYANAIIPFLSQNYSEIIMVDLRYYKNDVSVLAAQEKAEGILLLYSLDNLSQDDNLSFLF